MGITTIKRPLRIRASQQLEPLLTANLEKLWQFLQDLQNSIRVVQPAVGAAAANLTVTWSPAFPDANYSALAVPVGWNAYAYVAVAGDRVAASCKFTFSAAAPGGGGTLLVIAIR
jgi:hypothetical protein